MATSPDKRTSKEADADENPWWWRRQVVSVCQDPFKIRYVTCNWHVEKSCRKRRIERDGGKRTQYKNLLMLSALSHYWTNHMPLYIGPNPGQFYSKLIGRCPKSTYYHMAHNRHFSNPCVQCKLSMKRGPSFLCHSIDSTYINTITQSGTSIGLTMHRILHLVFLFIVGFLYQMNYFLCLSLIKIPKSL